MWTAPTPARAANGTHGSSAQYRVTLFPSWTAWAEQGHRLRQRLQAELGQAFGVARVEGGEV
jgi:hypothetical protein